MFYRRKILLALLEAFEGKVTRDDCLKLLLFFCAYREQNYYDFFPYEYGNFSFVLHQDVSRLSDLGLLDAQDSLQLKVKQSYIDQVKKQDATILCSLQKEMKNLRGKELLRKTYLEFPHYASRSHNARSILERSEYEKISDAWNKREEPCLFTVGYEGLSIDAYLDDLISHNIHVLVDVRKNPISMKYGFSKRRLADYAKIAGITYIHVPELGIPSSLRRHLDSPSDYSNLFDFYATSILPEQNKALENVKDIVHMYKRVAITCFEADHHFCHRHKITEYLEDDTTFQVPMVHLNR